MKTPSAVILAAGRGSRLIERTKGVPKCLLRFGESSIIEHQVAALRECGIRSINAVIGYRASCIQRVLGRSVRYIRNELFRYTNSLYSLWLARDCFQNGFILINGDVLFYPDILEGLLRSPHRDAIAVQRKSEFDGEEMKVQLDQDRILAISKTLPNRRAYGESLGMAKFSAAGGKALIPVMRDLIENGGASQWAPRAFDAIAGRYPIHAYEVGTQPWIEIDFPEDADLAANVVWPQIAAATLARAA